MNRRIFIGCGLGCGLGCEWTKPRLAEGVTAENAIAERHKKKM